jgi:hypothetical protein
MTTMIRPASDDSRPEFASILVSWAGNAIRIG